MKKQIIPFLAIVAILSLSAFATFHRTNWKLGEDYEVKFISKDPTGVFTKLSGQIQFDAAHLNVASFKMAIAVNSINTGNGVKNRHAVSDKWFDADKYQEISFISSSFKKVENGYEVTGNLKIKETTKEVTIPFTFENNVFIGSFMVNRLDYEIGTTKGMQKNASVDIQVDLRVPVEIAH